MFRFDGTEPPALTVAYCEAAHRSGHYGNARGFAHERRFVEIVAARFQAKWFHGVRRATKHEDQRGIDAVIDTTVGPLYAQVKSSPGGMRRFVHKKRRARVTVFIVNENVSDAELAMAVRRKLSALFHHIYELRGNRRAKRKIAEA